MGEKNTDTRNNNIHLTHGDSHHVINILHKISYPSQNTFSPFSIWFIMQKMDTILLFMKYSYTHDSSARK